MKQLKIFMFLGGAKAPTRVPSIHTGNVDGVDSSGSVSCMLT